MKILASDYDGTLNRGSIVSKEDIEGIEKWRRAGNLFGLVTGRSHRDASYEMKYYSIDYDFLICNNGSAIYEGDGSCVDSVTGDNKALKPLVKYIMKYNGSRAAISGVTDRVCVVLNKTDRIKNKREKWIEFDEIDNISFPFTQVDTNALTDENAAKLTAEINKSAGQYVFAHQNGINVDITPIGVSKPSGIYRLINRLKIPKENVRVVGDNLNDLEMIKEFNGYAVASGNPAVISKASKIYNTIYELVEDNLF